MTNRCRTAWFFTALVIVAMLAACGGGGDDEASIPAGAKVCQMQYVGVPIWGDVRARTDLENETLFINSAVEGSFDVIGGSYDAIRQHRIPIPQLAVDDMETSWATVRVLWPNFVPGPPFVSAKVRIVVRTGGGYRYGKLWACVVEDLDFGDTVLINAVTDPDASDALTVVQSEVYISINDWGNEVHLPADSAGIKYFGVPGSNEIELLLN